MSVLRAREAKRVTTYTQLFLALAILGPLIVGTSRAYRGMHNATDVICGLLIGAGCITVGYVAVRAGLAAAHRDRVDEEPTAEPHSLRAVQEVAR